MAEAHRKYEKDRVNTSAVIKFAIGLIVVATAIHFLIGALFVQLEKRAKLADPQLSPLIPRTKQTPPDPRLQISPPRDLQHLLEMENQMLNSYGWVDEKTGIVRIPIDQAMKLIVEREENTKAQRHEENKEKTENGNTQTSE